MSYEGYALVERAQRIVQKKPFDVVAGRRKHQLSAGQRYSSVCDPAKMFLTSKFSYLLFLPTPPIKLKLGLQICAKILISTHLEQPDQTKHLANHQQVLGFTASFTRISQNARSKTILLSQTSML
jgi:hypothetical protein